MNFKKRVLLDSTLIPQIMIEKEPENKSIELKDIYSNITDYQLLHCHIFLRFYWTIWRIGIIESTNAINKSNKDYNNFIKSIYICRQKKGIDDFLKLKILDKEKIYVNKSLSIFKYLKFKNPGLFECFGFCHKNLFHKLLNKVSLYPRLPSTKLILELNQQLGGTILMNNKGKVLYVYKMKYYGDYCPAEEIISFAKNYFGLTLHINIDKIEASTNKNNKYEEKSLNSLRHSEIMSINK